MNELMVTEKIGSEAKNGTAGHTTPLGLVVGGSLSTMLEVRLQTGQSVEDLRVGSFLVARGEQFEYFGMLSDIALNATNTEILQQAPAGRLAQAVLQGTSAFATLKFRPSLMSPLNSAKTEGDLQPVRTLPPHFSQVFHADRQDVAHVFGDEEKQPAYFHIGEPLDMDTPVCLNLGRLVERSNGIFGKSGTGKTFLTRIVLCGIIKRTKAVNLIFDMHNEYGERGSVEGGSGSVSGLRPYFGTQVKIFTLDPLSATRRKVRTDHEVKIPFSAIEPADVLMLKDELSLNETASVTMNALERAYDKKWLETLLRMDSGAIEDFASQNNTNISALLALQRKLQYMANQCRSFLSGTTVGGANSAQEIMNNLRGGYHVVLEFGDQSNTTAYMLVANLLTRQIHADYRRMCDEAEGGNSERPKPLVITIEEAHKFLSPALASQTIFGTIAREMRKYSVTLLIVDQRPSGIDDEVLSQVGTRICCLMDDERDVNAALSGVSGANGLKAVLASLDTKQQALILGHAVPMPVVVKTRTYDDQSFRDSINPVNRPTTGEGRRVSEAEKNRDFA